jgi:PKD repeat protein
MINKISSFAFKSVRPGSVFWIGLILMTSLNCYSQFYENGYPYALKYANSLKNAVSVPVYTGEAINRVKLLKEDSILGRPERYGIVEKTTINIKDGANTILSSAGGSLWQYKVKVSGAISIQLMFDKFIIPPGASLYIYDSQFKHTLGAYTNKNVQEDGIFVVSDFKGDNLIIEYFEPDSKEFSGQVIVGSIEKAYKDIISFQESGNAYDYVDINCPEGRTWQVQKHSVCLITFQEGTNSYICTGSLINDVTQDGIPYFLTANHCISTTSSARSMVAYFNYENKGCLSGDTVVNFNSFRTLTGASLMTTGTSSDYTLLKLLTIPPANYKPYYNGWDASGNLFPSSTGIHHPEGFSKRISIDYDSIVSYGGQLSWDVGSTSPANSHWQVQFDDGAIGSGSSGSPLFNNNQRVVGQLHGGDNINDYYGKLSYSWTHNNIGYNTLKSYLDPHNTNTLSLGGYTPTTNYPDAEFYSDLTSACINAPVKFFDNSAFSANGWTWNFNPATILYQGGTNASSKNPIISFTQAGSYEVKLVVKNNNAKDSLTLSNAIIAGTSLNVNINASKDNICLDDFDSLILVAAGATSYEWSLLDGADSLVTIDSIGVDKIAVKRSSKLSQVTSTISLPVQVIGTHGNCAGTTQYSITLLKLINDNVANAIPLTLKTNGPYSNQCATIENNEPVPPHTSCTGQKSWCDEYGTGLNIIQHTVWFTLKGPESGKIYIRATGFDCEIALYAANSAGDLLNNNYTLLAANDDASDTDPYPLLNDVAVNPGETYWLQLDGSGGGEEGTFNVILDTNQIVAVNEIENINGSFSIYPQPANSYLNINSNVLVSEKLYIEVYTITGIPVFDKQIENNKYSSLTINTVDLKQGIYIMKIIADGKLYVHKLVKN